MNPLEPKMVLDALRAAKEEVTTKGARGLAELATVAMDELLGDVIRKRPPRLFSTVERPWKNVQAWATPGPGWLTAAAYAEVDRALVPLAAVEVAADRPSEKGAPLRDLGELRDAHLWPLFRLLQSRAPWRLFVITCGDDARERVEAECKLTLSNYWAQLDEKDEVAVAVLPRGGAWRVRTWTVTKQGLNWRGEAT